MMRPGSVITVRPPSWVSRRSPRNSFMLRGPGAAAPGASGVSGLRRRAAPAGSAWSPWAAGSAPPVHRRAGRQPPDRSARREPGSPVQPDGRSRWRPAADPARAWRVAWPTGWQMAPAACRGDRSRRASWSAQAWELASARRPSAHPKRARMRHPSALREAAWSCSRAPDAAAARRHRAAGCAVLAWRPAGLWSTGRSTVTGWPEAPPGRRALGERALRRSAGGPGDAVRRAALRPGQPGARVRRPVAAGPSAQRQAEAEAARPWARRAAAPPERAPVAAVRPPAGAAAAQEPWGQRPEAVAGAARPGGRAAGVPPAARVAAARRRAAVPWAAASAAPSDASAGAAACAITGGRFAHGKGGRRSARRSRPWSRAKRGGELS